MKYTKPPCWIECPIDVRDFLHSLPAEFEIVEPGNVQVRWPEGWMKWRLCELAKMARASGETAIANDVADALWEMAAIAPEEKKKRKVWLWEKDHPHYTERSWTSNDIDRSGGGWRKVGECEVDQ